jgi:hypothetical protein
MILGDLAVKNSHFGLRIGVSFANIGSNKVIHRSENGRSSALFPLGGWVRLKFIGMRVPLGYLAAG